MSQGRPRIQVVRLSSNERAKIHLDGVQLHAEFRHFRSGDYISATSVKDTGSCPAGSTEDETDDSSAADTKKRCYRFRRRKRRKRVSKSMETVASSELTTKSCDNIFHDAKKKKTRASPYVWKDATRSEEHLPKLERLGGLFHRGKAGRCASHDVFCFFGRTLRVDDKRINEEPDDFRASMTSQSLPTSPRGSRALQKSSTMPQARRTDKLSESGTRKKSRSATLTSFFKKLSPRLRRSGRHRDKPWIVVEFSRQDIEGSDSASVESDHSFELAVRTREALLEQQQQRAKESAADGTQQPQSSTTVAPSTTKKSEAAAKPSTKYKKSSAADEKQFLFKLSPKKVMHEVKQSLKNGRGRSNERNRSSTDSGKVTTNAATRTEDGRDSQVEPPERKHDVHFATPHIFIRSPDTSQASTSPEKADSTLESEGADPMKSDPFLRQGKGTPRPHTLSIRNKIVVRSPQMEKVAQKMASFESIGSCSLDADVTASESSEAVEGSVSQHTLHSVSIDMASQNSGRFKSSDANIQKIDNNHAEDQLSSPEYVKRTVKLFNSIAGSESVGSPGVHMNGGLKEPNLSNGNVKEEDESSMLKKPSYVGLSCSISGYTNITTYNSKLREGFRSRDHSPARFVLGANKSRDASPLRTDSQGNHLSNGVHPISKPEFGNRLVAPSLVLEVGSGSRGSCLDTSHMSISPIPKIVTVSDSETFTSECEVCVNGEQSGDSNVPEKKESPRKEETEKERLKVESDVKKERSPSHSPGAVRVVEFTSQTKSYVQTVMRSFSSTTSSSSSVEKKEYGRSLHSEISSVQSAIIENSMSTCNSDKSFIQQRIERLYGPGALAQGFFRKTRQLRTHDSEEIVNHKETSSLDSLSVNDAQQLRSKGSSPELPVLRHLRPEFREQLPVKPISTGKSSRKTHEIWSSSSETSEVGQEEETELPIAEVEAESKPIEPVVLVVEQPSEDAVDPTMCASVTKSQDSIPDLQPAAPEVVLPTQVLLPEPEVAEPSVAEGEKENERDGHYFLKLLKQETNRLDELVAQVEADLSANNLPEEASGKLRSASGQAQLLMRQKLQQFEGLCHKNIAQSPDEPFPTTSEDLAGFWDMVKLQIEHVDRLFEEISRLKKSNWVEDKQAEGDATASASTNSIPKKRTLTKRPVSRQTASAKSTKASEASKAREEARRKMMEERRKAMKAQKEAAGGEDEVKIFVPESK